MQLGRALAYLIRNGKHRHRVVIGKDTRLSGYMLEQALAAGITSMGVDVVLVGPLPTPGIANITTSMRADAGAVISASHNPYQDNGIKFFWRDGFKLPDETEAKIEELVASGAIDYHPPHRDEDRPGRPPGRRARPLHRVPQDHLPARADAGGADHRRRLRQRRRLQDGARGARGAGRQGHRAGRASRTARTSTTSAARCTRRTWHGGGEARGPPGHRAGRRRGPPDRRGREGQGRRRRRDHGHLHRRAGRPQGAARRRRWSPR